MLHVGIKAATLWIPSMFNLRVALAVLYMHFLLGDCTSDVKQRELSPRRLETAASRLTGALPG